MVTSTVSDSRKIVSPSTKPPGASNRSLIDSDVPKQHLAVDARAPRRSRRPDASRRRRAAGSDGGCGGAARRRCRSCAGHRRMARRECARRDQRPVVVRPARAGRPAPGRRRTRAASGRRRRAAGRGTGAGRDGPRPARPVAPRPRRRRRLRAELDDRIDRVAGAELPGLASTGRGRGGRSRRDLVVGRARPRLRSPRPRRSG